MLVWATHRTAGAKRVTRIARPSQVFDCAIRLQMAQKLQPQRREAMNEDYLNLREERGLRLTDSPGRIESVPISGLTAEWLFQTAAALIKQQK